MVKLNWRPRLGPVRAGQVSAQEGEAEDKTFTGLVNQRQENQTNPYKADTGEEGKSSQSMLEDRSCDVSAGERRKKNCKVQNGE